METGIGRRAFMFPVEARLNALVLLLAIPHHLPHPFPLQTGRFDTMENPILCGEPSDKEVADIRAGKM